MFPAHTAYGERNQVERDAPRVRFRTRERQRHCRTLHRRTPQRRTSRRGLHMRQRLVRVAPYQHRRQLSRRRRLVRYASAPRDNSSFLRSALNFAIFVLLLHSLVRVPFSACLLRDFFMGAQRTRPHLRKLCNDARNLPVR